MKYFTNKVLVILTGFLIVCSFVFAGNVRAIDGETLAAKYQITFPINELGNCADYSACKTYCEDPVNAAACTAYAKRKGFYQEEPQVKLAAAIATAKNQLGCDSFESCQNFCEIPANHDKCASFAKEAGLTGGYVEDAGRKEILDKANSALGCSTPDACKSVCEKSENRERCDTFAKDTGLNGGRRMVGPGGCTSEESCRSFCSDPANFQICRGFSSVSGKSDFKGPGGCTSESSCRSYCLANPSGCPGFNPNGQASMSPLEACNRTANCSWKGNSCSCGQYGETGNQSQVNNDPAASCNRYGCSFANNTCRCNAGNVTTTTAVLSGTGAGAAWCTPPADPNFCGAGKHFSYNSCRCDDNSSGGSGSACAQRWDCPPSMTWNNSSCDCRTPSGDWRPPTIVTSTSPGSGSTPGGNSGCTPPSDPNFCGSGKHYSYSSCGCENNSSSACSSRWSCPTGMSWNESSCDCRTPSGSYQPPNSYSGTGQQGSNSCQYPSSGCGSNRYWDSSACMCKDSGSNSGSPGMTRDSQDAGCRAGGGTCQWNGDMCNCQGYHSPSGSGTSPMPSPSTSTGMSRDQQQAGCSSCGGTCNWNGDTCQCQCGSSAPSTAPNPSPTPAPASNPTPSTDPATACGQTSGCSWTGSACQCGSVNGIFRERAWWEVLLEKIDLLTEVLKI